MSPLEVIAAQLEEQGAAFPNAGAALILLALSKAGFTVIESRLLLAWQSAHD